MSDDIFLCKFPISAIIVLLLCKDKKAVESGTVKEKRHGDSMEG